jgi:hypothetical protein
VEVGGARLVIFQEAPHIVEPRRGAPQGIVFQNPEHFPTQVSLSTEKSTLYTLYTYTLYILYGSYHVDVSAVSKLEQLI